MPPSKQSLLIRFIIILIFGVIANFFVKDPKIIVFGMTLGSFLIVWPLFLSDENISWRYLEKKLVLRSLLALFVSITYLTGKLSITTFNIGNEVISIYLQGFNKERIIKLVGDSFIWTILMLITGFVYSNIRKKLNEKVTIYKSNSFEEPDMNSSHLEIAATEEIEIEECKRGFR